MNIRDAFEQFMLDKEVAGLSPRTMQTYRNVIEHLFIDLYFTDKPLNELTVTSVKNYILDLRGRDLSDNTVKSYVRHLRVFLDWLYVHKHIDIDFRRELPKIKGKIVAKKIYEDDEIQLIFASIEGKSPFEWKARTMIALMLDCGLRQSEVCGLMIDDINLDRRYITVRNTKSRTDRLVPFSAQTKRLIMRYIQSRNWDKPYLFVNDGGEQSKARNVRYIVNKYVKGHAGIKRGNSHLFRHTFATRMLMEKEDVYYVQQMLGHHDISVTRVYLHEAQRYRVLGVKYQTISSLIGSVKIA